MSSDDDRLTFGEGPLGGPLDLEPEEVEPQARPNRAFIIIAIAMAGLIVLGIIALVFALTIWLPARRETQIANITRTAEADAQIAAAWTPTSTATPTTLPPTATATLRPTETAVPTATSTKVVSTDKDKEATQATATARATVSGTAAVVPDGGGTPTTPAAGLGGIGTAAIAVGLSGLIFAVRKIRTSG